MNGKVSQRSLWYASLAKQCPDSPCFVAATAAIAGQQRKYVFAQTYTLYMDEWQLIVTMATELSLIGRVDTKVRNKALVAPWGCRAFEQVSAMLLAGCPGKKDVKKDVKTLQTRN